MRTVGSARKEYQVPPSVVASAFFNYEAEIKTPLLQRFIFLSQLKKNIKISNRRHQEEVLQLERRFLEEKVKADRQLNKLLLERRFLPLVILASLFLTTLFSAIYSSPCQCKYDD